MTIRNGTNRLKVLLAEKDSKIIQLETEKNRLKEENDRLTAGKEPAKLEEWARQEVVATCGSVLEILEELVVKAGVVYGNVAAIQGIHVNKRALDLPARVRRELALKDLEHSKKAA